LFLSATPDALKAAIVFCGTLAIGLATSVWVRLSVWAVR
jgi:hypothetical protein